MKTMPSPYWMLVLYHDTGPREIGVIGPFETKEKAEAHQREHGPRLAMLVKHGDAPRGPGTYWTTPIKHIRDIEKKR